MQEVSTQEARQSQTQGAQCSRKSDERECWRYLQTHLSVVLFKITKALADVGARRDVRRRAARAALRSHITVTSVYTGLTYQQSRAKHSLTGHTGLRLRANTKARWKVAESVQEQVAEH